MNKKLIAVTLAAAGFASMTSAADVQVYGLIDTSLAFVSSDADVAGQDRKNKFSMENAREFGSRFGLRGTEDLGNGYKIGFVLENGFKSDDGSLDQSSQTQKLFGREAHVDLYAPWGTVSFGVMPVFGSTLGANGLFRAIDPLFANYTQAFGSSHVTASSWTRVDNAVSYVTPKFGPFTGYAMYSFKMAPDTTSVEGRGGSADRYAALGARFQSGAVEAVLVADTTMYGTDRSGAANEDDGYTVTLGGNYTFDNGFKVIAFGQYFDNQELNAKIRAGVGADGIFHYTDNAGYGFVDGYGLTLGVNMPAGGGVAKASIAYRDMDNQDNVDFRRIIAAVGYDYPLSKRTAVYAMGGYSQEKVEASTESGKPNGYELVAGIVHRF